MIQYENCDVYAIIINRLIISHEIWGISMEKGLDKSKIYAVLEKYIATEMPLAKEIRELNDLVSFVEKLDAKQVSGKHPMLSIVQTPEHLTPVRLDLYWKPSIENVELDWDDFRPYTQPWLDR